MNKKFTIHMECDMIVESDKELSERFKFLGSMIEDALCHAPFSIKAIGFNINPDIADMMAEYDEIKKEYLEWEKGGELETPKNNHFTIL